MVHEYLLEIPVSIERSIQYLTRVPGVFEVGNTMAGQEHLSEIPKSVAEEVRIMFVNLARAIQAGTKRVKANTCSNSSWCFHRIRVQLSCSILDVSYTTTEGYNINRRVSFRMVAWRLPPLDYTLIKESRFDLHR
jgi:hypothetical protein